MIVRATVGLLLLTICQGQDWPAFRGPNSSGVSNATGLPTRFDSLKPPGWSVPVPFGRSSPVVKDNLLVLTASDETQLIILGLDAQSGTQRWRYSRPRPRRNELDAKHNDPASSTPTMDARSGVYSFFPDFGLIALTSRGTLLWELALGPFVNNYGMASSPVVSGESVFLQVDQVAGSYLLCVNKTTGAVRWKKPRTSTVEGWATPIATAQGEIVALSSNGLEAFDAETGDTRWSVPAPNSLMIPVPLLDGDRMIATFRGSDAPTFPVWKDLIQQLDEDRDGKLAPPEIVKRYAIENFGIADPNRDGFITEPEWNAFIHRGVGEFGITSIQLSDRKIRWRHKRGLPYVPSPLIYKGTLYSLRNGGILTAIDADTGALKKEGRLPDAGGDYFASLVAADGRLFAINSSGKLTVISATDPWEILSTHDLDDAVAATPAIAGKAIFIRTQNRLICFR